ncbi:MAG: 50S ribosomal protein L13 [Spirochaetaceae bacterium]|nr:MAG: 50S ribosomal protein L13 [Spirochaetaceae bacterium]
MKTIYLDQKKIERKWYIVDAEGVTLGRLATKVATILRGKHKPYFTPHQELGDYVVVINAGKFHVSGNKMNDKIYYRHTGYPGGLRQANLTKMLETRPEYPVEHAVRGMLPKNRLGRKLFGNLKVYAGAEHPHAAQKPEPLTIE